MRSRFSEKAELRVGEIQTLSNSIINVGDGHQDGAHEDAGKAPVRFGAKSKDEIFGDWWEPSVSGTNTIWYGLLACLAFRGFEPGPELYIALHSGKNAGRELLTERGAEIETEQHLFRC